MDKPEFTAYELNKLNKLARKSAHYASIEKLIRGDRDYTIPQIKLLWEVKRELEEDD